MNPYLILSLIAAYFVLILIISFITSKGANNNSFFIANRRSPWFVVAFGMIGVSLSGVTFISVPGWVGTSQFAYMQMVLGYFVGYFFIAYVLLPIYYKNNLISIYTYLEKRFGLFSYKTGASFFLISRLVGASFRLFLVASVLQLIIFDKINIPFYLNVIFTIVFIWIYTFKAGLKTIIWTDTLQTFFMLLAVILSIIYISQALDFNFTELFSSLKDSNHTQVFFFDDYKQSNYFFKMFFGGVFIAIVMTGLDQDMMQKNLSCKTLKESQKNMFWFSFSLIFVNFLFLLLGALLFLFANKNGINLPAVTDEVFPFLATNNFFPMIVGITFILGLIAAAFSSADSALTALTTSFLIDIVDNKKRTEKQTKKLRIITHISFSALIFFIILIFNSLLDKNVIEAIFHFAGYTYGPLLGLFFFGIFTSWNIKDKLVPVAVVLPIIATFIFDKYSEIWFNNYKLGFEIIVLNGILTFIALIIIKKREK